jgi:ketopantoate reductase
MSLQANAISLSYKEIQSIENTCQKIDMTHQTAMLHQHRKCLNTEIEAIQ